MVLVEGKRVDGRSLTDLRQITCEVGCCPDPRFGPVHKGQTQSLSVTTLGTSMDEQRVEDLEGETKKSYMLHYNFRRSAWARSGP